MAIHAPSITDGQAFGRSGDALGLSSAPLVVSEVRFRVMGSEAHVAVAVGDPSSEGGDVRSGGNDALLAEPGLAQRSAGELERSALLDMAVARLNRLEATWSRFRVDSELSVANANPGEWIDVSDDTVALVDRALMARDVTSGRFDPTLLGEVVAAGYDRSLVGDGRLGPGPATAAHAAQPTRPAESVQAAQTAQSAQPARSLRVDATSRRDNPVALDRAGRRMRVAPGFGFDPGGIAKGFAADLVVGELLAAGADAACVNIGGDLRVGGDFPGGWIVAIEDPLHPDGTAIGHLSIAQGGVATSSRCRRRWTRPDGSVAHHLIDPTTGEPALTDVLAVTIVAAHGWTAEALATAVFLAGLDGAEQVAESAGATGLLVTTSGVISLPGLEKFLTA